MISLQVSYFVLYVRWPRLVGFAAEINETVKTVKLSIKSGNICQSERAGNNWKFGNAN